MVSIVDVVKGQAVSLANQGFKKVAGNLRGAVGSALNRGEVTASETTRPKGDPKAYTFPLDVRNPDQGLGNHGHYILFFINEQKPARISFSNYGIAETDTEFWNLTEAKSMFGLTDSIRTLRSGSRADPAAASLSSLISASASAEGFFKGEKADQSNFLIEGLENSHLITSQPGESLPSNYDSKGSSAAVKERPTTQLDTAIAMYMPSTVNVTYTANYTDTEIGSGAAAAQQFLNADSFSDRVGIAMSDEINRDIVDGLKKAALGTVGAIPGFEGTRELY